MPELAINGGSPAIVPPALSRVEYSKAARVLVEECIEAGALNQFYGGRHVRAFEQDFARAFGRSLAVAVNSGTSALHLLYAASHLAAGSEVLVPANAYVSAVSALLQCGLIPVLVDIDQVGWSMDLEDTRRKISNRTTAIMAVHMYGQPCDMEALQHIAREHSLAIFEDCGQAHGARSSDRLVGTFGSSAAYSVCCRKAVTVGEGGVVVSDDDVFIDLVRALAHKGKGQGFFDYRQLGFSYGMTEVQGLLGSDQVRSFGEEMAKRQRHAIILHSGLRGSEVQVPAVRLGDTHAYFKFPVLLPAELGQSQQQVVDAVRAEGAIVDPAHPCLGSIDWIAAETQSLCARYGISSPPDNTSHSTPVAADILSRTVCLEVGHSLTDEAIEGSLEALKKVLVHHEELVS